MIFLDFETYSEVDISCGIDRYANDPSTEILCLCYVIMNELGRMSISTWRPGSPKPQALIKKIKQGEKVVAHNIAFDRAIWNALMGDVKIEVSQCVCTMELAKYFQMPASLENLSVYLGSENLKDTDFSKRTLRLLCKPRKPTKTNPNTRYSRAEYPGYYEALEEYCRQDVRTTIDVYNRLNLYVSEIPEFEFRVIELHHIINSRGIPIDVGLCDYVVHIYEKLLVKLDIEAEKITDGEVTKLTEVAKIKEFAKKHGAIINTLSVAMLRGINRSLLQKDVNRLIELRILASNSSVRKYKKMSGSHYNGRLRNVYMYYGAVTGRFSSIGVQLQNLPRGQGDVYDQIVSSTEDTPNVGELFKNGIRNTIKAPKGYKFCVSDFSNIEARVNAWISGHTELLEAFRRGKPIYEEMASKIYNKPVNEITKDSKERFLGKMVVLGCGYQMGAATFRKQMLTQGEHLSEEYCVRAISTYRIVNRPIADNWDIQALGFKTAYRGSVFSKNKVTWKRHLDKDVCCELPSGRHLYYRNIDIKNNKLCYSSHRRSTTATTNVYGGLLTENIVQAISRDILVHAMLNLHKAGFNIIMHSHDEIVAEVPEDFEDLDRFNQIMCALPEWCKDLPLEAEGFICDRYRK